MKVSREPQLFLFSLVLRTWAALQEARSRETFATLEALGLDFSDDTGTGSAKLWVFSSSGTDSSSAAFHAGSFGTYVLSGSSRSECFSFEALKSSDLPSRSRDTFLFLAGSSSSSAPQFLRPRLSHDNETLALLFMLEDSLRLWLCTRDDVTR